MGVSLQILQVSIKKMHVMKKLILTLLFSLLTVITFACHGTSITLVSGPTPIGSGQYSTVITACFAQYTAGNWGGTQNFQFTVSGTAFISFLPATITNNYKAYTTATCSGPNCFMGTCASVSAVATGSILSTTVIGCNTTSSTPAGFPIVPDDNESCTGCPTSFCFNFTFVTVGYPTSISLNGNIETLQPKVCRTICGFNSPVAPCNGAFDADMTITFGVLPIELLYFNGFVNDDFNLLEWSSASERNNAYYTIEGSENGTEWYLVNNITAAGNSSIVLRYTYRDYNFKRNTLNYYRLKQTDYDGTSKTFQIIVIDNRKNTTNKKLVKITNLLGQDVNLESDEILIYYYSDGSHDKIRMMK